MNRSRAVDDCVWLIVAYLEKPKVVSADRQDAARSGQLALMGRRIDL